MRPAVITLAWLVALSAGAFAQEPSGDRFARRPDAPYLDAAIQIAKWLEATAVKTENGWAWPAVPDEFAGKKVPKEKLDRSLYSGSAGIVVFGTQLGFATQSVWATDSPPLPGSPFLDLPREAARELLASLPEKVAETVDGDDGERFGLYTGIAGIGFALHTLSQATGWLEGHVGARHCVELLEQGARGAGAGIEWSDTTDVISGGAGIGLFLVYMAERDQLPLARDLAVADGRRLLELGEREAVGRSWKMDRKFPRVMPNFSHGTAGVAFFLARLYELTGDEEFLEGAIEGAHHVLSLADTSNDGCMVFHHSNATDAKDNAEGRALQYLGWCHGPIGTAQLFMKLAQVTGDADWTDWALRCAESVRTSGIPEESTPGFWNNVGLCCGTAGVASFFEMLAQARQSKFESPSWPIPADDRDQLFARRLLDWTLAHGTQGDKGMRFVQAEHRVKPELLQAQVGLMQGAAGVGLALLQFDSIQPIRLLDLPDAARRRQRSTVWQASIFPECPAARPDSATTAFENLGRAILFSPAPQFATRHGWQKSLRAEPPKTLACEAWLDAAESFGARLVLLQTRDADGFGLWDSAVGDDDVAKARPGADLVRPFVTAARARGFAVGLSLPLGKWPDDSRERQRWHERARTQGSELLETYGPLALLRVDVPEEVVEWPQVAVARERLYETWKSIAPHTLIEFVTGGAIFLGGRGPNGVQRVGQESDGHYDPNYEGGFAPRRDELWPTDVVADFDHGPLVGFGFQGPGLRTERSPDPDSPWRIAAGRRRYVPLQIELPLGRVEPRRNAAKKPPVPLRETPEFLSVREMLEAAAARSRNVLLVVPFEANGKLNSETIADLRELGR